MTSFDALPVAPVGDLGISEEKSDAGHTHQIFSETYTLSLGGGWFNESSLQPLKVLKAADFCVISGVVGASVGGSRGSVIANLEPEVIPGDVYRFPIFLTTYIGLGYWVEIDPVSETISTNVENARAVNDLNMFSFFYRTV